MSKPLLSVVIPVYNSQEFLSICIDSVLNQTEKSIEIILVNDASSDGSQKIINKYRKKHDNIKCVKHKKNKGLLMTRQSGVKVASGQYIANLDSDDYVHEECYEKLLLAAKKSDADIVQCGMNKIVDGDESPYLPGDAKHSSLEGDGVFLAFLNQEMNFSVCNKIFRRSLWLKCQEYFPKQSYMVEDLSQNLFLSYFASKYVSIPERMYNYVITPDSDSRECSVASVTRRFYSGVRHMVKVKRFLKERKGYNLFEKYVLNLEKKVYFDYGRKVFAIYKNRKGDSNLDVVCARRCLQNVYRINGFFPLSPYFNINTPETNFLSRYLNKGKGDVVVSIIVPIYGTEKYLEECVESVLSQTYQNFEIILVNDASPDRSQDIIDKFVSRDNRIRSIRHIENRGLLQSRLSGVREAKGKYIAHLDSDDYYLEGYLERLVNMAESTNADVSMCGFYDLTSQGNLKKRVCNRKYNVLAYGDIFRKFLTLEVPNQMWNKLYRRELWALALPYFPRITYKAEDLCQNMYLMHFASKLVYKPEPLYVYRIRENSGDRVQDLGSICNRAIAACYNIRKLQIIANNFVYGREPFEQLKDRYHVYFRNNFVPFLGVYKGDNMRINHAMKKCLEWVDWTHITEFAIKPYYASLQTKVGALTESKSSVCDLGKDPACRKMSFPFVRRFYDKFKVVISRFPAKRFKLF